MGIPKYFRYISERWPNISQLVNDSVIPEFDNLYLDMNSILHTATHKDNDVSHHLSEEEMFINIFNYIEHLFSVIKPRKVFYMAIDGVAPRAKMNQQRSRRFRSALDAETARRKAIEAGVELPAEDPFDSNAITPGTEFMTKLTVQLKFFISRKISEDSTWQETRVILSGHEVPGEGEHKIMNFIRALRSQPDYRPNTRHCLYGLDADLIMLGLSTHEPHFALLREEVVFGRGPRNQSNELSEKRFFLLHLSLTREYLQLEFDQLLGDAVPEEITSTDDDADEEESGVFDFERILDDFILINFLIGNDFLPELPMLLINDGALPVILDTYKQYLLTTKDYITCNGVINFARLKNWIKELSKYQVEKFETQAKDAKWFNNELDLVSDINDKRADAIVLNAEQRGLIKFVKPFILNAATSETPSELALDLPTKVAPKDLKFLKLVAQQTGTMVTKSEENGDSGDAGLQLVLDIKSFPTEKAGLSKWLSDARKVLRIYEKARVSTPADQAEKQALYDEKFTKWRDAYYKKKFGAPHDSDVVKGAITNYLEGLQWVLSYYYRGCPSWSWYYQYHYAPMTVDLCDAIDDSYAVNFGPSRPFLPFEQLMGVLPDRSKKLVPPAYHDLMTESTSPIIDFYPHTFEQDKNGKKNDWEAVVLIPFIDQERLLAALETRNYLLTDAERARNSHSSDLEFKFNPQVNYFYGSTLSGLPDVANCHCEYEKVDPHSMKHSDITYGILDETKTGSSMLAGFPSLETLDYSFEIKKAGLRVFEQESRNDSIVLNIKPPFEAATTEELAHRFIDTAVFIGYPFLREAKVTAISDSTAVFSKVNGKIQPTPLADKELQTLKKQASGISRFYNSRKGVYYKDPSVLVHVARLKGLIRQRNGSYEKEYGASQEPEENIFPLQLVVEDVVDEDERFKEREALPVEEEYPLDSRAILLLTRDYGSPSKVVGYSGSSLNVEFSRIESPENLGAVLANEENQTLLYRTFKEAATLLKVDALFLSRMTSRFLFTFEGSKFDLGIVLKKPVQNLKVQGYSRKGYRSWELSDKAISLIAEYLKKFPQVLKLLSDISRTGRDGIPDLTSSAKLAGLGDLKIKLQQMKSWLAERTGSFSYVSINDEALTPASVSRIESWSSELSSQPIKGTTTVVNKLPRGGLLAPSMAHHQLRRQRFSLGNRVMNALDYGKVPLFSRGTVVGINTGNVSTTLDVVFDREFEAGTTLDKRLQTKRGLTVEAGSVLNLTYRQLNFDRRNDVPQFFPSESLKSGRHKSVAHPHSRNLNRPGARSQPGTTPPTQSNLRPAAAPRSAWSKQGAPASRQAAKGVPPVAPVRQSPVTPGSHGTTNEDESATLLGMLKNTAISDVPSGSDAVNGAKQGHSPAGPKPSSQRKKPTARKGSPAERTTRQQPSAASNGFDASSGHKEDGSEPSTGAAVQAAQVATAGSGPSPSKPAPQQQTESDPSPSSTKPAPQQQTESGQNLAASQPVPQSSEPAAASSVSAEHKPEIPAVSGAPQSRASVAHALLGNYGQTAPAPTAPTSDDKKNTSASELLGLLKR